MAMISFPSYENNRLARIIPAYYYEQLIADPTEPLLNHAVGAELPAGSVFKLVTAVGALNEVVVTPEGAELVTMEKGDLVTFPSGMVCTWNIRKAVKKHFTFDR